jgi:hypothetical protein
MEEKWVREKLCLVLYVPKLLGDCVTIYIYIYIYIHDACIQA